MASSWVRLATVTLGSDDTSLDTGDDPSLTDNVFASKKYLRVEMSYSGISGGATDGILRVGNGTVDTGSTYAQTTSVNKATDVESDGTSWYNAFCWLGYTGLDTWHYTTFDIVNVADKEKFAQGMCIRSGNVGAGNAIGQVECVAKWDNASDQINRIELTGSGGDGKLASGSTITVFGADDLVNPPSLPNGSVFITSDTNVHYMFNSSAGTWNEVA